MEIRLLTADDTDSYWKIRLEALECESEAFGSSAEEHRDLTLDEIARRLSYDPANNFVVGAFDDDRLVGTAGFFRNKNIKERHKGHVWGVYLSRDARGMGAGRHMLRVLLEHASAIKGVEQILLAVATTQNAAVNLYRSLGFQTFGVERRALKVGGRYVDEEHMVLFIDAKHAS